MSFVYDAARDKDIRLAEPHQAPRWLQHKARALEAIRSGDIARVVHVYKSLTHPTDATRFILPTRDVAVLDRALFDHFGRRLHSDDLEEVRKTLSQIQEHATVHDRLTKVCNQAEVRIMLEDSISTENPGKIKAAIARARIVVPPPLPQDVKTKKTKRRAATCELKGLDLLTQKAEVVLRTSMQEEKLERGKAVHEVRETLDSAVRNGIASLNALKEFDVAAKETSRERLQQTTDDLRKAIMEARPHTVLHIRRATTAVEIDMAQNVLQQLQRAIVREVGVPRQVDKVGPYEMLRATPVMSAMESGPARPSSGETGGDKVGMLKRGVAVEVVEVVHGTRSFCGLTEKTVWGRIEEPEGWIKLVAQGRYLARKPPATAHEDS